MNRNIGSRDRLVRIIAAIPLLACSVMAPLPLAVRLAALAAPAAYLLITGLAGFCLGYRMLGRSTCGTAQRGHQ